MLQEGLTAIEELEAQLSRWQLQRLLGGPYDEGDAVLSIQASARKSAAYAACLNGLRLVLFCSIGQASQV